MQDGEPAALELSIVSGRDGPVRSSTSGGEVRVRVLTHDHISADEYDDLTEVGAREGRTDASTHEPAVGLFRRRRKKRPLGLGSRHGVRVVPIVRCHSRGEVGAPRAD